MKHEAWNIPVLQPEKLDKDFMLQASSFMPDVFIVAAYAKVLPKEILERRPPAIGPKIKPMPKAAPINPIPLVRSFGEVTSAI